MRTKLALTVVTCLLLTASWSGAEEIVGLPLHVERLDPATVRVWLGDYVSTTAITAFATARGIVVVDTFGVPEVDVELRRIIARELDRSDFRVLINTHEHVDHTGGNAAYADCSIVGHERIAPAMVEAAATRDQRLDFYPTWIAETEAELAGATPGSADAAALRESLTLRRLLFGRLQANPTDLPPTTTFSDRMALDMGDTTFELSWIGGMHSASDTAVFVPERGLLLTGDVMADVWLTDTPGCLASFSVRPGIHHDFPLMLANWDRLLAERERIRTLLPGHWNGELSIGGAEARIGYVHTLWEGVSAAAAEGRNLEDVQAEYRLDTRFPDLVGSPGFDPARHFGSVSEIWTVVSDQQSAARAVYDLLDQGADDAAVRAILAERGSDTPAYFFIEGEFNAYGYALLQHEKVDQAIEMFRVNVELYPDSWNVYDSLGEALLAAGRTAEGVAMYERSLALNPDNTNGREVLARVREAG